MDVEGAPYLYALAGLMITFGGFSTLLLALRPPSEQRPIDRFLAKTILTHVFVLTGAALLPMLGALYAAPLAWIWRVCAVVFAAPMLAIQLTYPHRRRKASGEPAPFAVLAVFVGLGAAATLAMVIGVFAGLPHPAAIYVTALSVDFFTVAYGFLIAADVIAKDAKR